MDFSSVKKLLIGNWQGVGTARYPTIKEAGYIEEFNITDLEDLSVLRYEQKSWYTNDGSTKGDVVFWETGFWIFKDDELKILSSQYSGRFEELILSSVENQGAEPMVLFFKSKNIIGDQRVVQSARKYLLGDNRISYQLDMEMENHRILENHLSANLRKQ